MGLQATSFKIEYLENQNCSDPELFFLTAIWLPHGQLLAIVKGQSHSPDVNTAFLHIQPEGYREPSNEFESLNPVECLVGF